MMSGALTTLRMELPHVQWEIKNQKKKGIVADKATYKQERFTGVQTTRDNAFDVITSWLKAKDLLTTKHEPIIARILAVADEEV